MLWVFTSFDGISYHPRPMVVFRFSHEMRSANDKRNTRRCRSLGIAFGFVICICHFSSTALRPKGNCLCLRPPISLSVRLSLRPYGQVCLCDNSKNIFRIFLETWFEYLWVHISDKLDDRYRKSLNMYMIDLKVTLSFFSFLIALFKLDPWHLA